MTEYYLIRSPNAEEAGQILLVRSEEHTSELQSRGNLVCRLLLEKKKRRRPLHWSMMKSTTFFSFSTTEASLSFFFFFFNDTATTEIYTLSLHDALPIRSSSATACRATRLGDSSPLSSSGSASRSEEHTSELQSRGHLVCRLLLEKKKTTIITSNFLQKKNK